MAWTDTQIANLALIKLGEQRAQVTSVTGSDTSNYGLLVSALYELTRQEELRSYAWNFAIQRVQVVQAQVTTTAKWTAGSNVMTVGTTVGMIPGWLVSSTLIQGGGQVSFPVGIPSGTTILSITNTTTLVMSNSATISGTAVLVFQVNNLTGYWFAYVVPANLRGLDIYAVFPNYTFVWPFKIQNIVEFGFINEAGYIYSNLDPGNGNPIFKMQFDPGVALYTSDFVEMVSCKLAMKMCRAAGKGEDVLEALRMEYNLALLRAQGNNQTEGSNEEMGSVWWVADRRGGR